MVNINTRSLILNIDGTPIQHVDEDATRLAKQNQPNTVANASAVTAVPDVLADLTLGHICISALLVSNEANMAMLGNDKVNAYQLAKSIRTTMGDATSVGVLSISDSQASQLSNLIADNYTVLIAGQCLPKLSTTEVAPDKRPN